MTKENIQSYQTHFSKQKGVNVNNAVFLYCYI